MRTVIGVFSNEPYAEEAIVTLDERGFQAEDISVLMKDTAMGHEVEHNTQAHVVKGVASGATTGAVIGGVAGLLVGIGALTIPGIGAFVVGGPLALALGLTGTAAATVTGAVAGGLIGALMGLGLTKEEAEVYEERIKEGALLVAIPVSEEREEEVMSILSRFNATDITSVHIPTDKVRATSTRAEAASDSDYDTYAKENYIPRSQATIGMKGGRTTTRKRKRLASRDI